MELFIGNGTGPAHAVTPEFSIEGVAAGQNLDKASNRTAADGSANRLVVIGPEDNSSTKAAPQLDEQVDRLSELASARQRDLEFNIDEQSGKPVIKVVERSTDELVRQIPTEEALAIANKLEELRGLLIDTRA
ncbi:flagellar protein FlaG [Marinobacterium arenosum]|uniref:flagellar protein FlaG n=1 Tax=Marinobacterium arenosum TaxID=2862496 RepID=UPI001C96A2C0|nr:flagellar protein FlaG [Marinobacterium arenosum]MBY4677665.1 flagellar protein FlaG [Marinobacterium arenosum]